MKDTFGIKISQKGDLNKITAYLDGLKDKMHIGIVDKLDKYGRLGVQALMEATPVDTGETSRMWRYEIQNGKNEVSITFHNDNIVRGINIAIILQYGHGTGTGGWVDGRDYINPAIQPIFDKLAEDAWKEVTLI